MSRLDTCSLTKQDCVLPEKSKAHTPSWWNPFKTDMGFNISVSHMWMEESLPTWVNKNIQISQIYQVNPFGSDIAQLKGF